MAEDLPTPVLRSRDVEMQEHFGKLVNILGQGAEELGFRVVLVEEIEDCPYGLHQFLINRDREHGFRVVVRSRVVGEKAEPQPDKTYEIGPGQKIDLGCSQKEKGGPVTWRTVVSEAPL